MPSNQKPRVVIVGSGFGGLEAAKKLACKNVDLTVIDRTNYHLFQPLLYQVATAALSPADIAAPVRAILSRCRNAEVILAEVQSVNVDAKKVKTVDMEIDYDYLILATGARHSYFGHDAWEKLAPGLKSLEDAIELRRRILMAFEYAEKITDEEARRAAMNFVVIGGGPTGVEMAGATHRSIAGTCYSHRRRATSAGRLPRGFIGEREETANGFGRGSAHRLASNEPY